MLDISYTRRAEWHRLTARIDGSVVGHTEWASATDEYLARWGDHRLIGQPEPSSPGYCYRFVQRRYGLAGG